jgi:hypothetical protein
MATTYTYPDAYLARFCTEDRETRALADVVLWAANTPNAAFDDDWTERLVILQTYVIACLENQAATDDLFTAKLKEYRKELDAQLPRALAAAAEAGDVVGGFGLYSIPLERS